MTAEERGIEERRQAILRFAARRREVSRMMAEMVATAPQTRRLTSGRRESSGTQTPSTPADEYATDLNVTCAGEMNASEFVVLESDDEGDGGETWLTTRATTGWMVMTSRPLSSKSSMQNLNQMEGTVRR